jgi:hypothetical protein
VPSSPCLRGPAAGDIPTGPIDCPRQILKQLGGENPVSTRTAADVLDRWVVVILSEESLQRRGADPEELGCLLGPHLMASCSRCGLIRLATHLLGLRRAFFNCAADK